MHELSLTEKILGLVLETAEANQAHKVTELRSSSGNYPGSWPMQWLPISN